MKKIVFTLAMVLGLTGAAFANPGDLSLYTSLTTLGSTCGGVRVDLGNSFCTDLSAAVVDNDNQSYFADLYYGSWGVALSGSKGSKSTMSLMYCVEKSINKDITLGVATNLFSYKEGVDNAMLTLWDAYVVMPF